MNPTYCYLAAAALMLLSWRIWLAVRRSRERKQRAFQRKLETVLQPAEKIKAQCPQKMGRWILTNKRLLAETKGGFTALVLKDIRTAHGVTASGGRTTVPGKMAAFTIKAGSELTLKNTGPEFEDLVTQLSAQLKKQRAKAKKK